MKPSHLQLRKLYSDFWKSKNHKEIPPIPLVPQNDPTTLFTGSGMQQLVPFLLGETHPLGNRLYNIQPCVRAQDIEEVGDNRHDTFFEMMGNWSLGDYFKDEQLAWFWEFLTKILLFPKEKLYVSVFEGTKEIPPDEEALNIWKKIGINGNHIYKYGPNKNWWSRAGVPENMPAGEPGGPDSEVFYDFGEEFKLHEYSIFKDQECHPNCDCGRFLEIGNSVFMQYRKEKDGTFSLLPKMNVDFGGGLERITTALNNHPDQFLTDLYISIVKAVEAISQTSYSEDKYKSAIRIIADHIKTAVFLILDGVKPTNKEQGYILRRLLRRAAVKMHKLKNKSPIPSDFTLIGKSVLSTYHGVYFNTDQDFPKIKIVIENEIDRFNISLEKGLKEIQKINKVDGKIAFDLYQTFGFPLEITEELFKEKGQKINKKQFIVEFEKHKNLSRSSSVGKFKGGLGDNSQQTIKYHTATHLIHQALSDILGNDIRQEGSNITGDRLRFDFYCQRKPSSDEISKVGLIINEKINASLPVTFKIIPKGEALKLGAKSFFREKYPEMVKVYFIGDYSKEFCGGPHVQNTKDIGRIDIFKFEKIGSNLYRLYAK